MFTQKQVAEFKDGFQIIDRDRDGVIGKNDLRAMFDEIGRIASDNEIDEMLSESENPINFTTFLSMFAAKQSGENDEDEAIIKAFRAFEGEPGIIDSENFRIMLMAFGDKFTGKECDMAFEAAGMDDDGMIDSEDIIQMICGRSDEAEGEGAPAPAE